MRANVVSVKVDPEKQRNYCGGNVATRAVTGRWKKTERLKEDSISQDRDLKRRGAREEVLKTRQDWAPSPGPAPGGAALTLKMTSSVSVFPLQIVGLKWRRCFNFSYYVSLVLVIVASLFQKKKKKRSCMSLIVVLLMEPQLRGSGWGGCMLFKRKKRRRREKREDKISKRNHFIIHPETFNLSRWSTRTLPFPELHL